MAEKSLFTPPETIALAAVLDSIIPPSLDGRMPGAGEIGLVARIEADFASNDELANVVRVGLAALDAAAREQGAASFPALEPPARAAAVRLQHETDPSLVSTLLFSTLIGYYEHPQVLVALGQEPRPPFPAGYAMAPFDPALLEPVLQRSGKLYRDG